MTSFNYQFSYGELLATLALRNGATVCIIRGFEAVEVESGLPLLSEFDCPSQGPSSQQKAATSVLQYPWCIIVKRMKVAVTLWKLMCAKK